MCAWGSIAVSEWSRQDTDTLLRLVRERKSLDYVSKTLGRTRQEVLLYMQELVEGEALYRKLTEDLRSIMLS